MFVVGRFFDVTSPDADVSTADVSDADASAATITGFAREVVGLVVVVPALDEAAVRAARRRVELGLGVEPPAEGTGAELTPEPRPAGVVESLSSSTCTTYQSSEASYAHFGCWSHETTTVFRLL